MKLFPTLQPKEANVISQIAIEAVLAGDSMGRHPVGLATAAARPTIPINPELFGSATDGNRFSYGVRVVFDIPGTGDEQEFMITINNENELDDDDLLDMAEGLAADICANYPERCGHAIFSEDDFDAVEVIFAQRRY